MRKRLERKLNSMNPKGSGAWFYREFVKNNVENVGAGHFDMMLAGTRTMKPEVKKIINDYLGENNGETV